MDLNAIVLKQLTDLVSTVGVVGLVIVALWAFYSGRIVTKSAHEKALAEGEAKAAAITVQRDELTKQHDVQLAYVEARRKEEQDARRAAEERLGNLTDSFERLAAILQGVREELIRGNNNPEGHRA